MKNNKVLKVCIEQARTGERNLNVFDIMYETSLPYPELKEILDELLLQKELEAIDIKTYRFIGDIDRELDEDEPQTPFFESEESGDKRERALSSRRAYLEKRRQEIIAKMQAETENENSENSTDRELYDVLGLSDTEEDRAEESTQCEYLTPPSDADPVKVMKTIEYVKEFLVGKSENAVWYTDEQFLDSVAECLVFLISSDTKASKNAAIKKAHFGWQDAYKEDNTNMIAIYKRIVSELQGMSSYYYAKIRSLLT